MTKETTCFSGNCYACMDLCTVSQFLVCVNVCGNKKHVKPLEEAVRTVEREVRYLISWYVGMWKAWSDRRVKGWCSYSRVGIWNAMKMYPSNIPWSSWFAGSSCLWDGAWRKIRSNLIRLPALLDALLACRGGFMLFKGCDVLVHKLCGFRSSSE